MLYQLLGGGAAIFAMVSAALSLRGTGQPFPWEKTPDKSTEALTRWNQWAAVCACFAAVLAALAFLQSAPPAP